MANYNTLTLTLIPNTTTNSTTVTLTNNANSEYTNSYPLALQFCQQVVRNAGVVDDSGRWIPASAIVCISIS